MCDVSNELVARSSAARATGVMASACPSAPDAIISATAAIIALMSASVPDFNAVLAFTSASTHRANTASTHASTARRDARSASVSGPSASSARMAAASAGLPSIQIRLAARSVAHRCRSVSARAESPRRNSSATSPRPATKRLTAWSSAAAATPDAAAAVASRSARSRSSSFMVCLAASRYSSGSAGRSDSSVSSARRTVVWGSPSSRPASRVARSPRTFDRYISPAVARRNSPYSGCARRAISVPVLRSTVIRRICSAVARCSRPTRSASTSTSMRFVLRQRVDDQCDCRHQPVQLVAHQIAHALRDRDVTVPDPHPGHLADPARRPPDP